MRHALRLIHTASVSPMLIPSSQDMTVIDCHVCQRSRHERWDGGGIYHRIKIWLTAGVLIILKNSLQNSDLIDTCSINSDDMWYCVIFWSHSSRTKLYSNHIKISMVHRSQRLTLQMIWLLECQLCFLYLMLCFCDVFTVDSHLLICNTTTYITSVKLLCR